MPHRTIGTIVKAARVLMELSREELARKVNVTSEYIGHIERDDPVRVSERLATALEKELKANNRIIVLIDEHNVQVNNWRRLVSRRRTA